MISRASWLISSLTSKVVPGDQRSILRRACSTMRRA
jgi:hypothetical protein